MPVLAVPFLRHECCLQSRPDRFGQPRCRGRFVRWSPGAAVASMKEKQAMSSRRRPHLLCFCLTWAGALIGCSHGPAKVAAPEAAAVPVSQPVRRVVTDYAEF